MKFTTSRGRRAGLAMGLMLAAVPSAWATNATPSVEFQRVRDGLPANEHQVTLHFTVAHDPGPKADVRWEHQFQLATSRRGQVQMFRAQGKKGFRIGLEGMTPFKFHKYEDPRTDHGQSTLHDRADGGKDAVLVHDWTPSSEYYVNVHHDEANPKNYLLFLRERGSSAILAEVWYVLDANEGAILSDSTASTVYGTGRNERCADVLYAKAHLKVTSGTGRAKVEALPSDNFAGGCLLTTILGARDDVDVGSRSVIGSDGVVMEVGRFRAPIISKNPNDFAWTPWEGRYVRIEADGNLGCHSTNGADCVVNGPRPSPSSPAMVCGVQHQKQWGFTGYDQPGHWCNRAFADVFAVWSRGWHLGLDMPHDYARLPSGDVMCFSKDGVNCARWSPGPIRPLACGEMLARQSGGTGYTTPGHWCLRGNFSYAQSWR